jgi:hypothetical protein
VYIELGIFDIAVEFEEQNVLELSVIQIQEDFSIDFAHVF